MPAESTIGFQVAPFDPVGPFIEIPSLDKDASKFPFSVNFKTPLESILGTYVLPSTPLVPSLPFVPLVPSIPTAFTPVDAPFMYQ